MTIPFNKYDLTVIKHAKEIAAAPQAFSKSRSLSEIEDLLEKTSPFVNGLIKPAITNRFNGNISERVKLADNVSFLLSSFFGLVNL
jgi:hypothetical protein